MLALLKVIVCHSKKFKLFTLIQGFGAAQRKFRRSASHFWRKSAAHGAAHHKKNYQAQRTARRITKKITRRSAKRGAKSSKFRCALRLGVDLDYQPMMNKNGQKKFEDGDFADNRSHRVRRVQMVKVFVATRKSIQFWNYDSQILAK
jgi:hypothetical protein